MEYGPVTTHRHTHKQTHTTRRDETRRVSEVWQIHHIWMVACLGAWHLCLLVCANGVFVSSCVVPLCSVALHSRWGGNSGSDGGKMRRSESNQPNRTVGGWRQDVSLALASFLDEAGWCFSSFHFFFSLPLKRLFCLCMLAGRHAKQKGNISHQTQTKETID